MSSKAIHDGPIFVPVPRHPVVTTTAEDSGPKRQPRNTRKITKECGTGDAVLTRPPTWSAFFVSFRGCPSAFAATTVGSIVGPRWIEGFGFPYRPPLLIRRTRSTSTSRGGIMCRGTQRIAGRRLLLRYGTSASRPIGERRPPRSITQVLRQDGRTNALPGRQRRPDISRHFPQSDNVLHPTPLTPVANSAHKTEAIPFDECVNKRYNKTREPPGHPGDSCKIAEAEFQRMRRRSPRPTPRRWDTRDDHSQADRGQSQERAAE
jgi:hypothetical protein